MTGVAPAAIVWDGNQPRSIRFDDLYYSRAGGLAEARGVFLAGCGLPDAWAGRTDFVVGELGFGTGLNIVALLDLWRRARPAGARLHVFSVEAHPLAAQGAARALATWPAIAEAADALIERLPRRAAGFHRIELDAYGATLDLALMDVEAALASWSGKADAWFLDGFAPARNPRMWSDAVLAAIARRSAAGARLATFTVAAGVRCGLAAAGFDVAKQPGFGPKRERLEARFGAAPRYRSPAARPRLAIVGAGVAGAALARAASALGARPLVIEAEAPGAGASGNAAALVAARLDAGGGPIGALYAQALARAADLYEATPQAIIARGAYQLETAPKDVSRYDRVAASDLFDPAALERLDAAAMAAALDEPDAAGGLFFRDACVVEPAAVLAHWLGDSERITARIAALERRDSCWRLLDARGDEVATAEIVIVAAGLDTVRLIEDAPLTPLRGQVSLADGLAPPALLGAAYAIPTRSGVLFGATHDRDDATLDVRGPDHSRNLERLAEAAPALAARLAGLDLAGRASVRAVTPDFMPLAGAAGAPGLFVLSGLGSRGFCSAPLLAEHVAATALGAPSPLPSPLAALVEPRRFEMRRSKRLMRSVTVQADTLR